MTADWYEYITRHPLAHNLWLKVLGGFTHPTRRPKMGDVWYDLPHPQAGPCEAEDGTKTIQFVWDSKTHHLDIEIYDDKDGSNRIEWFYLNRSSGDADGTEDDVYTIPFKFFDYLDLIVVENLSISKKEQVKEIPYSLWDRFRSWFNAL